MRRKFSSLKPFVGKVSFELDRQLLAFSAKQLLAEAFMDVAVRVRDNGVLHRTVFLIVNRLEAKLRYDVRVAQRSGVFAKATRHLQLLSVSTTFMRRHRVAGFGHSQPFAETPNVPEFHELNGYTIGDERRRQPREITHGQWRQSDRFAQPGKRQHDSRHHDANRQRP